MTLCKLAGRHSFVWTGSDAALPLLLLLLLLLILGRMSLIRHAAD
jgi:hypothetical protein